MAGPHHDHDHTGSDHLTIAATGWELVAGFAVIIGFGELIDQLFNLDDDFIGTGISRIGLGIGSIVALYVVLGGAYCHNRLNITNQKEFPKDIVPGPGTRLNLLDWVALGGDMVEHTFETTGSLLLAAELIAKNFAYIPNWIKILTALILLGGGIHGSLAYVRSCKESLLKVRENNERQKTKSIYASTGISIFVETPGATNGHKHDSTAEDATLLHKPSQP